MAKVYRPPYAPLQPSKLRFQSGPPSPASPLIPQSLTTRFAKPARAQSLPHTPRESGSGNSPTSSPRPSLPIPWIWFCHLCRFPYPLGATRRCLNDGHFVCVGETVKNGKLKRHTACYTEFDFPQWSVWGQWRRHQNRDQVISTYKGKNCSAGCDFPSQCLSESLQVVSGDEARQCNLWSGSELMEDCDSEVTDPSTRYKPARLNIIKNAAAEQSTPLLSPIEEENCEPNSSPACGLGLGIAVSDFAAFRTSCTPVAISARQIKTTSATNVSKGGKSPVSPRGCTASLTRPFGFDFDNYPQIVDDEALSPESPGSPLEVSWNRNAGGIGIALSSNQTFEGILGEQRR
jgi:hypothetical protein